MARSSSPHRVQHKPRSESREVEVKTENQQLRSQNQQLRRENARLRREMEKRLPSQIEREDDTTPMVEAPALEPVKGVGCPQCGSEDLKQVQLPTKLLTACKACGWRQAV